MRHKFFNLPKPNIRIKQVGRKHGWGHGPTRRLDHRKVGVAVANLLNDDFMRKYHHPRSER